MAINEPPLLSDIINGIKEAEVYAAKLFKSIFDFPESTVFNSIRRSDLISERLDIISKFIINDHDITIELEIFEDSYNLYFQVFNDNSRHGSFNVHIPVNSMILDLNRKHIFEVVRRDFYVYSSDIRSVLNTAPAKYAKTLYKQYKNISDILTQLGCFKGTT